MENSIVVHYLINFDENASYSLVDSEFNNKATLIVKDGELEMFFEDGSETMNFGSDKEKMYMFVDSKNWYFSKMIDGEHHWKKYNPNPKERNTIDCTLRAYCAAFDISWEEAFDIASKKAKEAGYILNDSKCVNLILTKCFNCEVDEKYNKKTVKSKDRMTVNTFAMGHPYGTYILHIRGHLVTVKNGEYWDSWDSGKKKVDTVYILNKKN